MKQHILVINIKNLATFRFNERSSGQYLKTQYWDIQLVRTLWDPILLIWGLVLEILGRNIILPGQLNSAE
jgi:hypothetical protein